MPETNVYFVRHAEPDLSNHDDLTRALTDKGMRDRLLVTAYLAERHIDAVYSSPFRRAYDTVADFAENAAIQVQNTTAPMPMRVYRIVQYVLAFAMLLLVLIDTLTADMRTPIMILGGLLVASLIAAEVITQIQFKNAKTE